MKKNILYPDTPPQLIPSFVCHVDILGYSQLSKEAIDNDEGDIFLNKIRSALTSAYERIREKSKLWNDSERFVFKVFTDNIVVGYPLRKNDISFGEVELGRIFNTFSEFQVGLAMEGFLVRGGIAFGKHYMDDEIVFGDALLEAVKQDSSGGAPKVSLSKSAVKILQRYIGFYGDSKWAPQSYDLLQDADGSVFINYLQQAFLAFPDGGVFCEIFEKHKETLETGLRKYSSNPGIRAKYEWASRYHNSVIEDFLTSNPIPVSPDADEVYGCAVEQAQVLVNYKIDIESFAAIPGKLNLQPIPPGA